MVVEIIDTYINKVKTKLEECYYVEVVFDENDYFYYYGMVKKENRAANYALNPVNANHTYLVKPFKKPKKT